ncbi:hypothetical protein OWM54_14370 [Myxococcus sp. MISCRS1]|uniref:hypothetical protein n=1 Tax=Myxococcus sp. MISCRS1 TaxID=2996786 RepID=UPI0022703321|nr:hypothetical protein [Myxococcus sp. MISCRS1]MCY0998317.1 hypothetical protein [Myxococcus sp. MISCRS1]
MNLTAPATITPAILSFSKELTGRNTQPVYVPIIPAVNAKGLDCYVNAKNVAEQCGGQVVYGWRIWEWPGILLEAQAHAVVQKPDGTFVDVTPPHDGSTQDLFVPDPRNVYNGKRILTRQKALAASRTVDKYIEAVAVVGKLEAANYVDNGDDEAGVYLDERAEREHHKLTKKRIEAQMRLEGFSQRRPAHVPETGRCTCGSGDKVEDCHGPRPL